MPVRFQCPACNAVRSATDRLLGKQINCPECGGRVQLPTAEQVEEARQASKAQAAEKSSQPKKVAAVAVAEKPLTAEEKAELEERELAASTVDFSKGRISREDEMDMTPMVDVTFLLLIFFMVTASFSVQKAIQRPAQRSEDPSMNAIPEPKEENSDIVTVQVDEFNAFNVITTDWDRIAGSKQDLIVALNDARAGSGGQQPSKVVIQAHEDCIHRAVVDALDAGREAQFESFEVSTVEQFD